MLALHLGMTRGELEDRMSWAEFMDWITFFQQQQAAAPTAPDGNLATADSATILKGFGL
jgi:hypothetical protein